MKISPLMFADIPRPDDPPEGQCDCDVYPNNGYISVSEKKFDPARLAIAHSTRSLMIDSEHVLLFGTDHRPVALNRAAFEVVRRFGLGAPTSDDNNNPVLFGADDSASADLIEGLVRARVLRDKLCRDEFSAHIPQQLSAWLHITDACNLRCKYCYLPHVREDMPVSIGKSIIDEIVKSASSQGISEIKLKYAGGEPLLRFGTVQQIHEYASESASRAQLRYRPVLLTNGVLVSDRIAEYLKETGFSTMVSLDEWKPGTDSQRSDVKGNPTAEMSFAGALKLKSAGVPLSIAITLTSRNANGLPELVDHLLEHELRFSINFYRENDLSKSFHDLRLDEELIIRAMESTMCLIERRIPKHSLLSGLIDRANLGVSHNKPCGAGDRYLVFDYRGEVSKCQMRMSEKLPRQIGMTALDTIRSDTLGVQNISVNEKEGCIECDWRHWCAGGCPAETFRVTGRYDVKSPNCRIYKALFPMALRLEGLRLLKFSSNGECALAI
jgi:uncharacterized protein